AQAPFAPQGRGFIDSVFGVPCPLLQGLSPPGYEPTVGKGEAGVSQPLPPRCRSGVSSPHLPACGSRTGRPQPKLPLVEESRGVLDHDDRGTCKTLPGSATQVDG